MTCLRPLDLIGLSLSGYWCIGNSLGYRGYYENSNRAMFQDGKDGKSLRYENLVNLTQRISNGSGMNWYGKTLFYTCLTYIYIYIYIWRYFSIVISGVDSICQELYVYMNATNVQIDKMPLNWELSMMENMLYIHLITYMKTLLWWAAIYGYLGLINHSLIWDVIIYPWPRHPFLAACSLYMSTSWKRTWHMLYESFMPYFGIG